MLRGGGAEGELMVVSGLDKGISKARINQDRAIVPSTPFRSAKRVRAMRAGRAIAASPTRGVSVGCLLLPLRLELGNRSGQSKNPILAIFPRVNEI